MPADKEPVVLFITRRFPPSVGGMERFAFDLNGSLKDKVHLKLIKWGGQNKYLPLVLPWFFLRAFWILLMQRIDIIHAQDGVVSIVAMPLKIIFRKPLVVVIHGLDITYKNKLYQFLIKKSLKKADQIICISHVAMKEVTKRGILTDKVTVIPLGMTDELNRVDKNRSRQIIRQSLSLNEQAKIILSTGRLVKRKGVEWFVINVMPKLVEKDNSMILLISGGGPHKEQISKAIKTHNLDANIRLLGRTNREFLRDLYNGSDAFVMPNITVPDDMEGFGLVLLEAALCELPVVASGIEGIKDAVDDGQNGILVHEKDSFAFEAKLLEVLNNPAKADAFGKKARQFTLTNFNWDRISNLYVDIYKRLAG